MICGTIGFVYASVSDAGLLQPNVFHNKQEREHMSAHMSVHMSMHMTRRSANNLPLHIPK